MKCLDHVWWCWLESDKPQAGIFHGTGRCRHCIQLSTLPLTLATIAVLQVSLQIFLQDLMQCCDIYTLAGHLAKQCTPPSAGNTTEVDSYHCQLSFSYKVAASGGTGFQTQACRLQLASKLPGSP